MTIQAEFTPWQICYCTSLPRASLAPAVPGMPAALPHGQSRVILIVFHIFKARVIGCALQRAGGIGARLPLNHGLDLCGQFEVLIGHAFRGVVREFYDHKGIGNGEIGMMPGRLGRCGR